MRQRRRLTGGATWRQEVDAAIDLPLRRRLTAGSSREPSLVNGVINAVPTPVKGVRMIRLRAG
jgi:hypothetical protein